MSVIILSIAIDWEAIESLNNKKRINRVSIEN